jgi:hypothetical protein
MFPLCKFKPFFLKKTFFKVTFFLE